MIASINLLNNSRGILFFYQINVLDQTKNQILVKIMVYLKFR